MKSVRSEWLGLEPGNRDLLRQPSHTRDVSSIDHFMVGEPLTPSLDKNLDPGLPLISSCHL